MSLRRQLAAHYKNKSLSAGKLEELTAMTRRTRMSRGRLGLLAASLAVAVGAVLLVPTDGKRTLAVAEEIALNHTKDLTAEFVSASYAELGRKMSKLDFDTIEPRRLRDQSFTVSGARYCSLQGRIAAQVKLTDADGRTHTLYEVRALAGVEEMEVLRDGLRIVLWREGDLLLGLAGPSR